MNRSIGPISPGNERAEAYSSENDDNVHGPYFPPVTTDAVASNIFGQIQAVTVTYTDTYYIYAFDGRLLSEYDQTGSCVRDYIYAGNRLLAEYRPSTGKYYYYMSDQINSTRIITDDLGNVVYSEAYGPYGDVQKTWVKTYDPKQKFSGKEREGYSELDYFGARYFDNNSYRFISVDPIINKDEALTNPQLWNLYAYCRNNPITFLDPDGKDWMHFTGKYINYYRGDYGDTRDLKYRICAISGQGQYQTRSDSTGIKDEGPIPEGKWYINLKKGGISKTDKNGNILPGDGLQDVDIGHIQTWGKHRARLWPSKGTDDKGRTTLYLHDSETGSSKGCVSTWGDETIFEEMRTLRLLEKQKQIFMKVEYRDR